MTKFQILLMLLLIVAVCVLAVLYWIEAAAVRGLTNALKGVTRDEVHAPFRNFAGNAAALAGGLLPGAIYRRTSDNATMIVKGEPGEKFDRIRLLESENATLRADVDTGCRLINKQKATINQLRTLLEQSQARNRTSKHSK
jgi:hypothetical protein